MPFVIVITGTCILQSEWPTKTLSEVNNQT